MIRLRVTVPNIKSINTQSVVNKVATNLGKRVHKHYDALTGQWNDPPEFTETISRTANATILEVKTTDDKYRWVDLGTDPHPIDPKPENQTGFLVFGLGYSAGTSPKSLVTKKPTRSGPTVFSRHVEHPGAKPRNFEDPIIDKEMAPTANEFKELLRYNLNIGTEKYGI